MVVLSSVFFSGGTGGRVSFFRLACPTFDTGGDFVRKGFCQEGILSGRNFVRQEFCQEGILSGSGLCQEGILSGRDFARKRALPGRNFVKKRAL